MNLAQLPAVLLRKISDGSIRESVRYRVRQAELAFARAAGARHLDMRLENGLRFRIYFDSKICTWIYLGGFEPHERQFARDYLRPGDTFFDVGANYGIFSLLASERVGSTGQVHAFELLPSVVKRLTENVTLNHLSNVSIHPIGWSDADAELDMVVSREGFDAWASLTNAAPGAHDTTEPVRITSYDNWSSGRTLPQPTLVKLDVEGWEIHALRGAKHLLRADSSTDWLIEFSRIEREGYFDYTDRLFAFLRERGYRLFRLNAAPRTLTELQATPPEFYTNLFVTRNVDRVLTERLTTYQLG